MPYRSGSLHIIAEDRCPTLCAHVRDRFSQKLRQTVSVEDVIAQYQAGVVAAHEVRADDECFSKSVWLGLFAIREH